MSKAKKRFHKTLVFLAAMLLFACPSLMTLMLPANIIVSIIMGCCVIGVIGCAIGLANSVVED